MNLILSHPQKAKLKFFTAYATSILLLFFIFSLVRQKHSSAPANKRLADAAADKEKILKADLFLHQQFQAFDKTATAPHATPEGLVANVQATERALKFSIDSLAKEESSFKTEAGKPTLQKLLMYFRSNLQNRADLVKSYALEQHGNGQGKATQAKSGLPVNDAAVDELKSLLRQKEEQILALQKQQQLDLSNKENTIRALQRQVQNSSSPATGTAGDGEWKQKYSTIKSRYTELNTAYNSLSSSYQAVVADNRRLISQLERERNH